MLPFTALAQGAAVSVAPRELVLNHRELAEQLGLHRVSMMITTPSLITPLLALHEGPQLTPTVRHVYLCGEPTPADLLPRVRRAWAEALISNCYGLTETTGHTVAHDYTVHDLEPRLGLPTDDTTACAQP